MAWGADAVVIATIPAISGTNASELHYDAGTTMWFHKRQDGTYAPLGYTQPPAFGYVSNPGTVVVSTTPNNVVETRPVAAAVLSSGYLLEAEVHAFLTGTTDTKSMLVGIDADLSNALTAVFLAGQTGQVRFTAQFFVKAASPHLLKSRTDYNSQFGRDIKRGTVTVNLATTAINLLTEAWVANAADSITIDSIAWRLKGNGL